MMQKLHMSRCSESMPWSEISEGTSEMAEALCADLQIARQVRIPQAPSTLPFQSNRKSNSRLLLRLESDEEVGAVQQVGGNSIADWLRHDAVVDNVKFNGK